MTAAGHSRLVRGGFVFALVVLVLIGFGAYRQGTENIAAARWVAHTYDVQRQLALTLSTVQDIAIGARGYIISGKDEFLEPFRNGQAEIPKQIQALRQLTASIPEQQPRIDFLESLTARRIEFSQENITLRQTKGPEAAQAAVSGGEGERLMDQIRKVIGDMEATETTLLQQRTERLRASNLRMLGVLIAMLVLLAGLLLATYFLVRRDAAARGREHQIAQKAREYAENIVDTVRESLLVLDADLRVLSANRSFYQAFQVSPQETEGVLLYELGNGQWNISPLRSLLEEVLPKNSRVCDFEVEHDFPAIGRRTMLLNARKTFRVGNNTQSILLAIEDITERKHAEEALRRSEKWLSTTLGSIGDAVIATDQNGGVTFLNPVAQALTGWTQDDAQGKPLDLVFDIINQETRQPVENPVKKVFREGKVVGLADNTVLISKDRREFDIEDSAAPIVTGEGERIGVVLVFRDVTEQRKTEEERNRFFNLSRDMIAIAGFDGYFKSLNPAWQKMLAYDLNELLAKPYLEFVHPEDRAATVAEAQKLTTGAETISFENRYRCKDGSYKWILWSCTPSVGHQLIYAVARDITERKRDEAALRQAKEEAERTSKFKDQFLSTMSHELRTPLNAVLGFSELLADDHYGPLNDKQRRYVGHIHSGGQHLLKLINDILDLSKIEAGRLELSIEEVSLKASFAEVISALRPLAEKKSLKLVQEGAADVAVRADAMRLKQILMNLLGNAIKFTPEGGRIELVARAVDSKVRVEVRDTGPGIPVQEQKRIFESFYRLRQTGQAPEGTGLGLTITQRLVELHGGELGLESQPGQGSCFYFSLPALAGFEKAPKTQEMVPEQARGVPKILVIEDDLTAAHLIEIQLSASGYEPVICDQPQRAVEIAAGLQPHAITLDVLMKPVTGWEILLQLKSDLQTKRIPVILLTIVDQPGVGMTLGADEYLIKPVKKEALLAAVKRCLDSRGHAPAPRAILVVEDDAPTRDILAELLRSQGFYVSTAEDGAQARASVEASLPELVILDLLLPKVSGFELLAEWRASPRTAEVPVFVLTGKDLTPAEQATLRTHAELLLRKQQPWQEELIQQLRRVLPQAPPEGL